MTELEFRCGQPEDFEWPEPVSLFHEPRHLRLQAATGWISFAAYRGNNHLSLLIHFHIQQGKAASPGRAPFGSFLFLPDVSAADWSNFLRYIEAECIQRGIRQLEIKCPPMPYCSDDKRVVDEALARANYISHEDVVASIPILPVAFYELLHRAEKKKLRKSDTAGAEFQLLPLAQLENVYRHLSEWRASKNLSLSLSLADLQQLAAAFPNHVLLTAVRLKDQWIAANVSLRVTGHVLYNFYHDHDPAWDSLSPVVKLNEGLYNLGRAQDMQWLDLGTSLDNGRLRPSLLEFKERLGAKLFPKLTFRKVLTHD